MNLRLVAPTDRLRATFLRALAEFRREGLPWWRGGDVDLAERDFAAFVVKKLADASTNVEAGVPATHLWAVAGDDEAMVGRISIRHALDDALYVVGGHIGYDTVPSYRGRGVASEMLRQALPVARSLGLSRVLITCGDTNAASIRVIERNGGSLWATRALGATGLRKRYYWLRL